MSAEDADVSNSGLVVTRWRRYGKDRLYVAQPDGGKVGWWDLATGEAHPESPDALSALTTTVSGWLADQPASAKVSTDAPDMTPLPVPAPVGEPVTHDPSTEPASDTDREAGLASLLAGAPVPSNFEPDPDAPLRVIESATRDITPGTPAQDWTDLSLNRAGAEAREQAQAARDAAPVKTVLARVLGVHTDERAWRIGADGEEKVAAQLAKATRKDPRWRALHAIPVGERGSDIDHLIVGPGGVFTVNAKHHPRAKIWVGGNTFMVNGHRQPYIRNSRHEAARAAKLLTAACGFPVHVQGLVVTVGAESVVIKEQPDGVHVTPRNSLARWLLRHDNIHDPETMEAVYEAARRSTTWRT